jgi:predicted transcriptional regulator
MDSKFKLKKSNNGYKSKIVNYIRIHPGASFKTIQTIFGLSDSTLRYYLRDLEKNGLIRSDENKRVYYPLHQSKITALSETQRQLLHFIRSFPGLTQKELAAKTKINRLTIRHNINSLVDQELVTTKKVGKEVHHYYIMPEELERQKMLKLITKFLTDKIDEETYWDLRNEFSEEA